MIAGKAAERLRQHEIIWMTTVRPDGQPQSFPVWFVLEDDQIRIWSLDGVRVENLATNPKVSLHLSDNGRGGDVVSIEGIAAVDRSAGSASASPGYRDRYDGFVKGYDWTWDYFDAKYCVPIQVRPTKVRAW
jgi:PPOX class probable F420-dependent enzyme